MPSDAVTGAAAAELALRLADSIITHGEWVGRSDGWSYEMVRFAREHALSGGTATMRPHSFAPKSQEWEREAMYAAYDAAHMALWRRSRVVYDIDPDMWGSLAKWKTTTRLPEGLFARLPHPDPCIVFPTPLDSPMRGSRYGGTTLRTRACYINGRKWVDRAAHEQAQVSTHADVANGNLGLLFVSIPMRADGSPVLDKDGQPDMNMNRVSLDVGEGEATVDDLVAKIQGRFDYFHAGGQDPEALPEMVRATVGALVYLCARNAELTKVGAVGKMAARKVAGGKQGRPVKVPNVYQVGYRVGSMLRRARTERERGAPVPTGRVMPPHIRSAHPHLYRVGPGRREVDLKWLDPIRINMPEDAEVTTVIPIKQERTP